MELPHRENLIRESAGCFSQNHIKYYILVPPTVYTLVHILPLQQTEGTRSEILPGSGHYQYKHTF